MQKKYLNPGRSNIKIINIIPIIENVVKEKEVQIQKQGINLRFLADVESKYGLVKAEQNELKNIIVNLLQNSIEAMQESGNIDISVRAKENQLIVEIKDNGKGIPESILPKLMHKGQSFNKKNGNGYGLYHAKVYLDEWGGKIDGIGKIKLDKYGEEVLAMSKIDTGQDKKEAGKHE